MLVLQQRHADDAEHVQNGHRPCAQRYGDGREGDDWRHADVVVLRVTKSDTASACDVPQKSSKWVPHDAVDFSIVTAEPRATMASKRCQPVMQTGCNRRGTRVRVFFLIGAKVPGSTFTARRILRRAYNFSYTETPDGTSACSPVHHLP